ncbi:MAG: zf-HC2 domain-containing protein [Planctomycetes bacterium]|nr:zf-HC2 domain-containing protein [Planctomycetota bacterium]
MNHPGHETLALLAYGFLPAEEETAVRAHLADCPECRAEWEAGSRERSAVGAAFEGAGASAKKSWMPLWAGLAAGALLTAAAWGMVGQMKPQDPDAPEETAARGRTVTEDTPEWIGWQPFMTLEDGVAEMKGGYFNFGRDVRELRVGDARVLNDGAEFRAYASFLEYESLAVEILDGEVTLSTGREKLSLRRGDLAGILPGGRAYVARDGTSLPDEETRLQTRFVALQRALAARKAGTASGDLGRPEDIGRWMGRQIATGRSLARSEALAGELAALWDREMSATSSTRVEIQVGPARERFLAGYLDARGMPLPNAAWSVLLEEHTATWDAYRRGRGELGKLERALAAVRASAGWEERFQALLDDGGRAALADVAPAFRDWRKEFVPVFRVPVAADGVEKYMDLQAAHIGKDEDGEAREILREHIAGCFEIHRAKQPPAEEQERILELLIETRRRLVADAKLTEAVADFLLADYRESEAR